MRIRWRGLELPSRVELDPGVSTDRYGRFTVEPFERGFGITIGNSLRRILLSTIEGAAVTTVKIAEAAHEFTSIPGVLEDVTDIVLNVKGIVVKSTSDDVKVIRVARTTRGEVRAGDMECDPAIEIMNPDHLVATLTTNTSFHMELTVTRGRGYRTAEENRSPEREHGVIAVDAVFSPVERVRYRTEDTRVGQRTNYDRLILEIWTRGSVAPQEALVEAAKVLRKHLNPFVMYNELTEELVAGEDDPADMPPPVIDSEYERKLALPISALNLSVRANNCLESARMQTVGDLVSKTDADLLRLRAFGKTSLREVRRKLADFGLALRVAPGQRAQPVPDDAEEDDDASLPLEMKPH